MRVINIKQCISIDSGFNRDIGKTTYRTIYVLMA